MSRPAAEAGRRGLFYGWAIVAVSAMGLFAVASGTTSGFSVFVAPLSQEFGWTRTAIAGVIAVGTVGCALVSPLVGQALDRYGPRLVVTLAALVLGAALAAVSLTGTLLQLYIAFGLARVMAFGVIPLASTVAVANWFIQKRGRAVAIALLGESAGLAVIPLAAQLVTSVSGWRAAWLVLALLVWGGLVLPAALLLRRQPEDLGLRPDGLALPQRPKASPRLSPSPGTPEPQWTLGEAARTRALWLLATALLAAGITTAGVTVHQMAFLTDRGLAPAMAATIISVYALSGGATRLFWGFLAERVPLRLCLGGAFLTTALGTVLLISANSLPMALAYAVAYGCGSAGIYTLESVLWADYYGRASLGRIQGFVRLFRLGGNAAGPLVAGLAYDLGAGYPLAFAAFGLSLALSAVMVAFARPPQPPALKTVAPSA